MSNDARNRERQIWVTSTSQTHTHEHRYWCTPLILPTGGVFVSEDNITTTLTAKVTFKLPCDSDQTIISPDTTGNDTVVGFSKPFYASISPQTYVLGACSVLSYVLIILILITPRTFYVGGPGGGSGFLSRSGLISGGSNSIVGIGRRPLLQKIAALLVAVSLTIATADTFDVARSQYDEGYIDSSSLVEDVLNSTEIRVVRIISDTFLWLAQVQTLIRLFPRHKEKVTIKWLGFALVVADTVFSILDSFVSDNWAARPRRYTDAIPALNYLFELSISLIYASCVIFYSLSKRRFAFWHAKMRNICLVALISYVAITIPVVFFILDITAENIAVWGEYIRWVGAAAASVVVWEWVERIESLERDERKDGILGREIFDGDEMLDSTMSDDDRNQRSGDGDVEKNVRFAVKEKLSRVRTQLPLRRRRKRDQNEQGNLRSTDAVTSGAIGVITVPTAPAPAVSPPSRSETASAASTVYAVRYVNLTSPSPGITGVPEEPAAEARDTEVARETQDTSDESVTSMAEKDVVPAAPDRKPQTDLPEPVASQTRQFWQSMSNPFKRRRAEPPAEVVGAQIVSGIRRSPIEKAQNLKDRFGTFAKEQRVKFHGRNESVDVSSLPVMVIPAPKGEGRTWSPDDVRHASVATQDQFGDNADDSQARQETAGDSSQQPGNVVVIPAPTSGHSWIPPDPPRSSQSTPQTMTATRASPNRSPSVHSNSQGISRDTQTPATRARRRFTTSPSHVPPISERLEDDRAGSRPDQDGVNVEPRPHTASPRLDMNDALTENGTAADREELGTAGSRVQTPASAVSPDLEHTAPDHKATSGDMRDSGGTNSGSQ